MNRTLSNSWFLPGDPYARQVEFDSNWCFFLDPKHDWDEFDKEVGVIAGDSSPSLVSWNEFIIYELHCGTFVRSAKNHDSDDDCF